MKKLFTTGLFLLLSTETFASNIFYKNVGWERDNFQRAALALGHTPVWSPIEADFTITNVNKDREGLLFDHYGSVYVLTNSKNEVVGKVRDDFCTAPKDMMCSRMYGSKEEVNRVSTRRLKRLLRKI